MSNNQDYLAVVTLDHFPTSQESIQTDYLDPLLSSPVIRKVVLRVPYPYSVADPRVSTRSSLADERALLLSLERDESIAGIVRIRHTEPLRFPLTKSLINQLIIDAANKTPAGYHQLDLNDLPYPYLQCEVLGKEFLQLMRQRSDVVPDWLYAQMYHTDRAKIGHSNLCGKVRQEYLANPLVEYFTFPKFVALEASRLCNLRCTMCVTHSDLIDHSHLELYPKHFDLDRYYWILDNLLPYRRHVSIAPQYQGEPFMSPHIKEMIRYAKRLQFTVGFTSNATLWTEDLIRFMIEQQLDGICVSLDGATRETYEQVRIGARFETVVNNLKLLRKLRQEMGSSKPSLQINMTLMPENRHELELLLSNWLGLAELISVNNTCINHVVPQKFYTPDERYPCPFLWEGLHILTNGDVIACCRDSDYEEVMGNAYQTPLLDIWKAPKYERFRQLHREGRWQEIPICNRCDTWMCKTRRIFVEKSRLIVQHPFHRQYQRPEATPTATTLGGKVVSTLSDLWGAISDTGKAVGTGLLNLTVRSRN